MPEIADMPPELWNYRCPECGAESHGAPLTLQVDTDIHEQFDHEEMWPGGPPVPVPGMFSEFVPGARWFSTSLCEHRFSSRDWTLHYTTRDGDPVGRIEIARKAPEHV